MSELICFSGGAGPRSAWASYVGMSDDPSRRLLEHNNGKTKSTKAYRPFDMAYTEPFTSKADCRKRELFIKTIMLPSKL
jgi:predicted GIY-YIG superfamily endonuclease